MSWSCRLLKFCFRDSATGNVRSSFSYAHVHFKHFILVLRLFQRTLDAITTVTKFKKKKNLEELKECITVLLVECQPWFLLGTTTYVGPDSEKHVKYWWGWFLLISIAFDSFWRHSRSWHTPASLSGCISFLGEDTQENIYIFVPWTRFHTFECNILMISASPSLK